jgi:hypothetical protein
MGDTGCAINFFNEINNCKKSEHEKYTSTFDHVSFQRESIFVLLTNLFKKKIFKYLGSLLTDQNSIHEENKI